MKLPGINIILSCIIIACTAGAVGQSPKIAGLKKAVVSSKTSNEKLFAIFGLCEEWRNLPADTVHALASEAATLAAIAHDEYASWYSRYYLNVSLLKKAAYDSITIACKNAKKWLAEHPGKYEKLAVDFGLLQANVFIRSNQYKEAGSELYELLVKTEKIGDTLAQIKILSNLSDG